MHPYPHFTVRKPRHAELSAAPAVTRAVTASCRLPAEAVRRLGSVRSSVRQVSPSGIWRRNCALSVGNVFGFHAVAVRVLGVFSSSLGKIEIIVVTSILWLWVTEVLALIAVRLCFAQSVNRWKLMMGLIILEQELKRRPGPFCARVQLSLSGSRCV